MQNYKNLSVWKKSHELTLKIYAISAKFPPIENFGITSQIRRSCVSIPTNIAEGCAKNSNNDFCRYLQIALGSLNETEYLLFLSNELHYINAENYEETTFILNEIKFMLLTLIKKANQSKNTIKANII